MTCSSRIDQRTRLAGHNRLALLLFRLGGRQLFGVNVFKVQEVLRRPELFQVPGLPSQFSGVADVRGRSVPVLDLGLAIGHPEREPEADTSPGYLVVTEFNRSIQGFLVSGVERIVNIAVEDIHPPPELGAESSYLTAVTRFQGELIQVIDVESVLADIAQVRGEAVSTRRWRCPPTARSCRCWWWTTRAWPASRSAACSTSWAWVPPCFPTASRRWTTCCRSTPRGKPGERYAMVISDIEMPAMDGYR
jgi:two-component system chemotaxis response regulator CheV